LYLRENNYSKAWLAEQMGVSPQYVGKMLKGGSNVTLATIEKLETATGLVLLAVPEARSVRYRAAAVSGSVTDFFTKTFLPAEQPAYFSLA
jgi:transcriptional regulator with XRE-family HTH domain